MAIVPNSIVTPQAPKLGLASILPADTTANKVLYTGDADGSKIVGVQISSTDTAARDVQIGVTRGGVFYILATVTIPITAGFIAGVPAIDVMSAQYMPGLPMDNDGQHYIYLASASDTLDIKALTTVTAAKAIYGVAVVADF